MLAVVAYGVVFLRLFSGIFKRCANICLVLMLLGTAATIILRPLGISFYWIWPWTIVCFVWMVFFGMTPVYHEKKDITVEVVVDWLGGWAQKVTRFIAPMVTAAVVGTILWQAPEALSSQVGPFEGAVFPWGGEVERFYLSLPLFASCVLIMLESGLDILKAIAGVPEPQKSHLLDAEG